MLETNTLDGSIMEARMKRSYNKKLFVMEVVKCRDGVQEYAIENSPNHHCPEFCLELLPLLELPSEDGVSAVGTTCCLILLIHSHCSSSAALALLFGSLSKHRFKKSIPCSLNCSLDGS